MCKKSTERNSLSLAIALNVRESLTWENENYHKKLKRKIFTPSSFSWRHKLAAVTLLGFRTRSLFTESCAIIAAKESENISIVAH